MKKIVVQKYGGSSLSDVDKLLRVATKIVDTKNSGVDLVVVVSAMGDTTDELLHVAKQVSPNPSRRELDMLLSVGERISMALLSMAIEDAGLSAVSLTGSQCGIITTDSHTNAEIIDVRPFRVQDELAKGKVVIVAGFQGTSYKREVTTLGRGGSDTTAVALAAALSAEVCEIFSDVEGVFSADPRVVLDAQKLASISYEEMQELSRSGAKVLNDQAVEFAKKKKIALYAKSTHGEDSVGTIVHVTRTDIPSSVVAISHVDTGWWVVASTMPKVLEFAACGFVDWSSNQFSAYVLIDDIHDTEKTLENLQGCEMRELGLVSVVGLGIGKTPHVASVGSEIVGDFTARYIGSNRISWVVEKERVTKISVALHAKFIEIDRR